jgi:MYXO-CTERM domain-containing protein
MRPNRPARPDRLPRRWDTLSALGALSAVTMGLLLPGGALAADPVDYDEALQGDLPGYLSLTPGQLLTVFTLHPGVNRFRGSTAAQLANPDNQVGVIVDYDGFGFQLLPGTELVSWRVSLQDNEGDVAWTRYALHAGSTLHLAGVLVDDLQPNSPGLAQTGLSLGAGDYNVSQVGFAYWPGERLHSAFYDMELVVRVSPIPEPAGWLLGLAGLPILAAWQRRRRLAPRAS